MAQEVLLRLVREQREGHVHEAWGAWLTRVTVNACRDRRRSAWWRRGRNDHGKLAADDVPTRDQTPEEALLGLETRRALWTAFRFLSPRQQEVFALRHVEGFATAEVAAVLGVTEGSAKRHLFRAVHQLRRALRSPQ